MQVTRHEMIAADLIHRREPHDHRSSTLSLIRKAAAAGVIPLGLPDTAPTMGYFGEEAQEKIASTWDTIKDLLSGDEGYALAPAVGAVLGGTGGAAWEAVRRLQGKKRKDMLKQILSGSGYGAGAGLVGKFGLNAVRYGGEGVGVASEDKGPLVPPKPGMFEKNFPSAHKKVTEGLEYAKENSPITGAQAGLGLAGGYVGSLRDKVLNTRGALDAVTASGALRTEDGKALVGGTPVTKGADPKVALSVLRSKTQATPGGILGSALGLGKLDKARELLGDEWTNTSRANRGAQLRALLEAEAKAGGPTSLIPSILANEKNLLESSNPIVAHHRANLALDASSRKAFDALSGKDQAQYLTQTAGHRAAAMNSLGHLGKGRFRMALSARPRVGRTLLGTGVGMALPSLAEKVWGAAVDDTGDAFSQTLAQ